MGGSSVSFQTPTALYEALAGQNGAGLFGPTPFPKIADDYGFGSGSPYLSTLLGIQGMNPNNVWTGSKSSGPGAQDYNNALALSNTGLGLLPQVGSVIQGGQQTFNQLSPYIGQALTAGFDPQNALYSKLFQQQQDQTRAENAAAGVATTPYGAALATQGDQNFNLAWQEQQLARQAQGANTASTLAGAGMGALSTGENTAGNLLGAAGGAISAPTQLTQQQISDYLNYINSSVNAASAFTSGTNAATNAGANSTNSLVNAQNAANAGKGGIGGALGQIGGLVGKFATGGK